MTDRSNARAGNREEPPVSQARLLLELAARVHRLEDELERLIARTVDLEMSAEQSPGEAPAMEPVEQSAAPNPPVDILRNGILVTPEAETYLQERLAALDRFYQPILSKRIVFEGPVGHHQAGGPFAVNLYVDIPGRLITVTRQRSDDLHVAIRGAFDAAQRQLEDYARRQRPDLVPPEAPPRGHVVRLFPEAGYGFIAAPDGHELYFHRNSVLGDRFDEIEVGAEVRFAEESGVNGPQASTVAFAGD